ncbi:unnamed protein product [Closterium sp. NIES-64]|nr:unnamed protein product [Closterium sp. NIES-64]
MAASISLLAQTPAAVRIAAGSLPAPLSTSPSPAQQLRVIPADSSLRAIAAAPFRSAFPASSRRGRFTVRAASADETTSAAAGTTSAASASTTTTTTTTAVTEAPADAAAAAATAAAESTAAGTESEPIVDEAPKKKRRAPPRKLKREEKAVATWGWDGRSARDLDSLEQWLRAKGLPQQKLALRLVREGGRGLVATENIGKGEGILNIPEKLLITGETVYSCPRVGALLKAANVPDWPALAVYLLSEAGRGAASEWSGYIETLPRAPPCILQWSIDEVDVLLKGSPVRQRAIEAIADVTNTFSELEAALFSKHRDVFPEKLFTLNNFKWAFAVLFSRLVRLPSRNNRLALVPWGDMLNHRCEIESCIDVDTWKGSVVFTTDRAFAKGKEVFVSYGPKSNGELLLAYGVVPATRNPSDSVSLLLALSPDDPLLPVKEAALQANGLTCPLSFPVRMDGWPSQLLAFARLVAAGPSVPEEQIRELAAATSFAGSPSSPSAPAKREMPSLPFTASFTLDHELEAREVILAACRLALAGYSTTLQEDEALLEGNSDDYLEDDGEQRVRVMAAAALRSSERRILLRTDFVLRSELRDMRNAQQAKAGGKQKIDLGNNFGGESASFIGKILRRISRVE